MLIFGVTEYALVLFVGVYLLLLLLVHMCLCLCVMCVCAGSYDVYVSLYSRLQICSQLPCNAFSEMTYS